MEIVGKIIEVCAAKSGVSKSSGNAWESQEYVLETEGTHPERCVFSVFGKEKISEFNIKKGEMVTASINLNAREYNGRWYNSMQAWRIMKANPTQSVAPSSLYTPPAEIKHIEQVREQAKNSSVDDEQLPF